MAAKSCLHQPLDSYSETKQLSENIQRKQKPWEGLGVTIIIEKVITARSDICSYFKGTESQEKNKECILKLAKQIQFLYEISVANYLASHFC